MKKVISFSLTIILIFGSSSFVLAAPANADDLAVGLGSGWSTTSNSNGILSIYSPSGYSGSWFRYICDLITNNTLRNFEELHLNSYDSSVQKLFKVGDTLSYINSPSFRNGSFIVNLLNGLSVISYDLAYLGQQFYSSTSNLNSALNSTIGIPVILNNVRSDLSGLKGDTSNLISISGNIKSDTSDLLVGLEKLVFMYADDDSLAAKRAESGKTQSVVNSFTGSGSSSASVSDFADVSSGLNDLKNSFSGGASPSQAFSVLGSSSESWWWFSNEVSESLDTTNSGLSGSGSRLRGASGFDHPLYDSYLGFIFSHIGGDLND